MLLPMVVTVLMMPVYLLEWHYETTLAIPMRLIIFIAMLLFFVNLPLVVIGGIIGK
jgi:hypothetical protein